MRPIVADCIQDTPEYQALNVDQKHLIDNLPPIGSKEDIEILKGIIQEFAKSSSDSMMFYRSELRVVLFTWEGQYAQ